MLQVRENEMALREWSGGTAQLGGNTDREFFVILLHSHEASDPHI